MLLLLALICSGLLTCEAVDPGELRTPIRYQLNLSSNFILAQFSASMEGSVR